jgi:hypothetical protein
MKRILIMLILTISLIGCDKIVWYHTVEGQKEVDIKSMIPPGAVSVTPLGNEWYTFDLDGRSFMIRIAGRRSLFTELDT